MVRPIAMFVVLLTFLTTLAACKSTPEQSDASGSTADLMTDENSSPTPEPEVTDTTTAEQETTPTSTDVAQNQSVFADPAPQSLGASSSGLGR